ncbi:MAG: hypothetical protein GY837_14645 [Bosea sp.]|uniref:hypothetical protein n=1 Tax=Bosea sp. (in: a-proteobacteria) TaxID=1871050 RepID=UPI001484F742|nr:hypothetical protein [Bosea sp. (in: a-proteobacteria)]
MQPMIGAEATRLINRPQLDRQKQDAGAEIAAEQQLLGWCRPAGTLLAADLAEGLLEALRITGDAGVERRPKGPGRIVGIEPADHDLMEEIGKARRIGGIRTASPDGSDTGTQTIRHGEQPRPPLAPPGRPFIAALALELAPPDGAARHFFVNIMLGRGDLIGEKWQCLALEALLAMKGSPLSRCVGIGFRAMPVAEAHGDNLLLDTGQLSRPHCVFTHRPSSVSIQQQGAGGGPAIRESLEEPCSECYLWCSV